MQKRLALAFVVLSLALGGCARHVHHHHEKTVVADTEYSDDTLEHQHKDTKVIIVNKKRHLRNRHCWNHRRHWHCRP